MWFWFVRGMDIWSNLIANWWWNTIANWKNNNGRSFMGCIFAINWRSNWKLVLRLYHKCFWPQNTLHIRRYSDHCELWFSFNSSNNKILIPFVQRFLGYSFGLHKMFNTYMRQELSGVSSVEVHIWWSPYIYRKSLVIGTISIYVTEMTKYNINFFWHSVRGALISTLVFGEDVGQLLALIIGNYFSFYAIPKFAIVLMVCLVILFSFLPETPLHLLKGNKIAVSEMWFLPFWTVITVLIFV